MAQDKSPADTSSAAGRAETSGSMPEPSAPPHRSAAQYTQYFSIFENAGVGVANVGFDGTIKDVNAWLCKLIGYSRADLLQMTFAQITHPDDIGPDLEQLNALLHGTRASYRLEKRYVRANGEFIWADLTVTVERDENGQPCGLISVIQDISQRKKDEERLNFLLGELTHRSKNLLTVIRATMRQIGRTATSVGDFENALDARIASMAASQDLLFRTNDYRTSLAELLRGQLAAFVGTRDARVQCLGPELILGPNATRVLGMGLHELATNSCKYGALSAPHGKLSIRWRVDDGAEGQLRLTWVEQDGPAVTPPTRAGFGRKVTELMVAASLQGEVTVQFLPSGLQWQLTAPLGALQA